MTKILIDIGHPAHVHLFKHFAHSMLHKGYDVLFATKEKEFETELLQHEGFRYVSFGKKHQGIVGKALGLIKFNLKLLRLALNYKPDIFLSHGSMYAAQVAWLLRKPHISFEDTFNAEQVNLYKPFTKHILTGDYEHPLHSHKIIRYAGYHALAYLHPQRFTPDSTVLSDLGLQEGQAYVILRFVSWGASHDVGHQGLSSSNKMKLIEALKAHATVFISSEKPLPPELKQYQIPIAPHRMHHAIAFASLVFGESATMAEEAAVLGVPAIYIDNTSRLYTQQLEADYQLMYNYNETPEAQKLAIDKAIEIVQAQDIQHKWARKRDRMLAEKMDVTAFLVRFIENYPKSAQAAKKTRL